MNDRGAFIAKTLVPRRRPETLRRQRLLDSVIRCPPGGLAVVRAPAGYGKTTLLVDIARETNGAVCWISLDQWDSDLPTFLRYLRLSIRRALSPDGPVRANIARQDPRTVLGGLTALLADFDGGAFIFLDDFHEVANSRDIAPLVDYLARRLPSNCRLIIGSRTPPALPSLPKMRLDGRAIQIDAPELAFTADEIKQYYQLFRERDISDDEAFAILKSTQGWPAGVALLRYREPPDELPDASVALSEYLAAEVFDRLPDQLRTFMLSTSALDVLDAEACESITGRKDAEKLLETLERSGVPVIGVHGPVSEYRVHPLFRDFLRTKLRREDPQRYRELNKDAARWLVARGRHAEAIRHFAQSEDWDATCDAILEEASQAYRLGRWHAITSWLDTIPRGELRRRPRLRLWEARILARFGQSDDALRVVSEIIDQLDGSDEVLLAELETIRGTSLRVKGDITRAQAACERAVALAARGNAPVEVLAQARKQLGLVFFVTGSFEEAAREFRAGLDIYEQRGDVDETAFISGCLGSALGSLGLFAESLPHFERARKAWRKLNNLKELSWVLNNLAMVYVWMDQPERARELFLDSLGKARQSGHQRAEAYSLASLADLDLQAGDHAAALSGYEEALTIATDTGDMTLSTYALIGLADAHRAAGDPARAELIIHRVLADAQERKSPHELGLGQLALGKLRRRQGKVDDAIASFEAAVTLFGAVNAKRELAEALFHLAESRLATRRQRTQLKDDLEKLAAAARELTHDAFIVKACREAPAVAEYGISKRIAASFYRDLLRRSRPQAAPRGGPLRTERGARDRLPTVEVVALGDAEVRLDGRPVMELEWESEKSKEMFLLLLMSAQPMRRGELIAALWPDTGGKRATSVFHSTLHRLRRALYSECVVESGGTYALNPSGSFQCDALEFERLLQRAEGSGEESPRCTDILRTAFNLWRGAFAPDLDAEWADTIRTKLEREFLDTAARLSDMLLKRGDSGETAAVCSRLLAYDPYNEAACFRLMRAQTASGLYDSAVYTFRRYAETLERDVGDRPGRAIMEFYTQIRDRLGQSTAQPP